MRMPGMLWFLSLAVPLVGCGDGIGGKTRESRAILFLNSSNVMNGQTQGSPYNLIDYGASLLFDSVRAQYGASEMLFGNQATVDGFVRTLDQIASASGIDAVDLMVNLHGGEDGSLAFADRTVPLGELAGTLRSAGAAKGKLRVVYNTACFAKAQLDAWLAAGFRVVNGAIGSNANGFIEYPGFVANWTGGMPFGDAVERASQGALTGIWDSVQRFFGAGSTDSRKVIAGERAITINGL